MAVTQLQQRGLVSCQDFKDQVNGIVVYQALLYAEQYKATIDQQRRDLLARISKNPDQYGFANTIVTDGEWALTFDAWAADTAAAGSSILTGVVKWFSFLTGFTPPEQALP